MSPRPSGYHFAGWSAQWLLDVAISRSAYRCLHCFGLSDELIERLAPPVAEAHAIVRIAILLVLMHGEGGVFRSFSVRLQHDDRGEGRNIEGGIGWPVAGLTEAYGWRQAPQYIVRDRDWQPLGPKRKRYRNFPTERGVTV